MPEPSYVGAAPPRRAGGCSIVLGLALGVVLLVGGGGLALLYWGLQAFTHEAQAALQKDAVILEHIGTIRSLEADVMASGAAKGADEFVFAITGDRGSGKVLAELVTEDSGEVLHSGTLTLADGREWPLAASAAAAAAPPSPAADDAPVVPDDTDAADNYKDGARPKAGVTRPPLPEVAAEDPATPAVE